MYQGIVQEKSWILGREHIQMYLLLCIFFFVKLNFEILDIIYYVNETSLANPPSFVNFIFLSKALVCLPTLGNLLKAMLPPLCDGYYRVSKSCNHEIT